MEKVLSCAKEALTVMLAIYLLLSVVLAVGYVVVLSIGALGEIHPLLAVAEGVVIIFLAFFAIAWAERK